MHYRLNGLAQFCDSVSSAHKDTFVVDIQTTAKAGDSDYPFTPSRESITGDLPTKVGQVDFFAEGDLPYYIDDCTGYVDVTMPPGGLNGTSDPVSILIQIFLNGDMCGTVSALPGVALPLSMFLLRAPVGTRRRRKD